MMHWESCHPPSSLVVDAQPHSYWQDFSYLPPNLTPPSIGSACSSKYTTIELRGVGDGSGGVGGAREDIGAWICWVGVMVPGSEMFFASLLLSCLLIEYCFWAEGVLPLGFLLPFESSLTLPEGAGTSEKEFVTMKLIRAGDVVSGVGSSECNTMIDSLIRHVFWMFLSIFLKSCLEPPPGVGACGVLRIARRICSVTPRATDHRARLLLLRRSPVLSLLLLPGLFFDLFGGIFLLAADYYLSSVRSLLLEDVLLGAYERLGSGVGEGAGGKRKGSWARRQGKWVQKRTSQP
ncbi:hypothetical protein BDZ91DRAFT_834670 [Kalaharituber pfeilii]|nr:hypothetical protein BDZ91DRAFT_834670 [Kalaharituber pfeilii]